jgi:hypothetical protein
LPHARAHPIGGFDRGPAILRECLAGGAALFEEMLVAEEPQARQRERVMLSRYLLLQAGRLSATSRLYLSCLAGEGYWARDFVRRGGMSTFVLTCRVCITIL